MYPLTSLVVSFGPASKHHSSRTVTIATTKLGRRYTNSHSDIMLQPRWYRYLATRHRATISPVGCRIGPKNRLAIPFVAPNDPHGAPLAHAHASVVWFFRPRRSQSFTGTNMVDQETQAQGLSTTETDT
jgi:hypothetical protein